MPKKHEYILSVRLSQLQVLLYRRYLETMRGQQNQRTLFAAYHNLARVWTHPIVLDESKLQSDRDVKAYESMDDFVVSSSDEEWSADVRHGKKAVSLKQKSKNDKTVDESDEARKVADEAEAASQWWGQLIDQLTPQHADASGKIVVLLELLDEARKLEEKVLVFSQSLAVLELIEQVLDSDESGHTYIGHNYIGHHYVGHNCVGP